MANEPWNFEQPLCAEVGLEIFYLKDRDELAPAEGNSIGDYALAKSICHRCDHLTQCAEWGLENEFHGVWGGMTPVEREKVRSNMRITSSKKKI